MFKYGASIFRASNADDLFFSYDGSQRQIAVWRARITGRVKKGGSGRPGTGDERLGWRELRLRLADFMWLVRFMWFDFAKLHCLLRAQARIVLRPDRDQLHEII